jgi:hypothetical protein
MIANLDFSDFADAAPDGIFRSLEPARNVSL